MIKSTKVYKLFLKITNEAPRLHIHLHTQFLDK